MCHVYQIVFVAAIYTPRTSSKKDGWRYPTDKSLSSGYGESSVLTLSDCTSLTVSIQVKVSHHSGQVSLVAGVYPSSLDKG